MEKEVFAQSCSPSVEIKSSPPFCWVVGWGGEVAKKKANNNWLMVKSTLPFGWNSAFLLILNFFQK